MKERPTPDEAISTSGSTTAAPTNCAIGADSIKDANPCSRPGCAFLRSRGLADEPALRSVETGIVCRRAIRFLRGWISLDGASTATRRAGIITTSSMLHRCRDRRC
jgi:hypothetical protein